MPDKSANSLIPIVKQFLTARIVVVIAERHAYNPLTVEVYTRETVSHRDTYENPGKECHTQGLESSSEDSKA